MADKGLFGGHYDTPEDAAAAALLAIEYAPRAANQEYMTLLVEDPTTKRIRREAMQTQGSATKSEWSGYPQGPIRGLVHNHPVPRQGARYRHTMFSQEDINSARLLQVPAYVAAMQEKGAASNRLYQPTRNRALATQPIEGEEFLAQYPIEELKMIIASRIRNSNMLPGTKARLLQSLIVPQQTAGR